MDNVAIGGTTPLAGAFTTLRVNSTISLAGSTGTSGYVMTSNGASAPTWSALPAGSITITDDTTTNATRYLAFTSATSGSITGQNVASTKLQFNPSTGLLSSTGLNLSGLTASSAVATDASKNLVSVTNTGSGNNVLATSPTLVTPILGTPTSGNLANCTMPAGSVIQVVTANDTTDTTSSSSTFSDTNITATITPKFSTSKILVLVSLNGVNKTSSNTRLIAQLVRNASTALLQFGGYLGNTGNTNTNGGGGASCTLLDSPATTSATSYKVQIQSDNNTGTVYVNLDAYSTITLMEIAG
jgi:hypothetical protein